MASSQDLVPKGQPYGERQQNVAQMRAAGVPTSSEGAAPSPAGGGRVSPGPAAVPPPATAAPDLSSFDVFTNRQPSENYTQPAPREVSYAQVRNSHNQIMQSIASRMSGYLEG